MLRQREGTHPAAATTTRTEREAQSGTRSRARAAAPRTLPLIAVSLGYFMVILDATVVTVALPVLGQDLQAGVAGLEWVVDAYTVVFAGLLLLGGSLSDRYGSRTVFQAALALFTLASAACGLAPPSAGCWSPGRCRAPARP
jgi:MFS family permease